MCRNTHIASSNMSSWHVSKRLRTVSLFSLSSHVLQCAHCSLCMGNLSCSLSVVSCVILPILLGMYPKVVVVQVRFCVICVNARVVLLASERRRTVSHCRVICGNARIVLTVSERFREVAILSCVGIRMFLCLYWRVNDVDSGDCKSYSLPASLCVRMCILFGLCDTIATSAVVLESPHAFYYLMCVLHMLLGMHLNVFPRSPRCLCHLMCRKAQHFALLGLNVLKQSPFQFYNLMCRTAHVAITQTLRGKHSRQLFGVFTFLSPPSTRAAID